jgi:hypothetical protein
MNSIVLLRNIKIEKTTKTTEQKNMIGIFIDSTPRTLERPKIYCTTPRVNVLCISHTIVMEQCYSES